MKSLGFKVVNTFLVLAVLALLVTGCGSSSTTSKTPPQIPPLQTFLMPFDEFGSGSTGPSMSYQESQMKFVALASSDSMPLAVQQALLPDPTNWLHSAISVGFWSAVVVVGLAVPVASFKASFLNTPVQQADGSWVWSYSVPVIGTSYTAKLHGIYIDKGVRWEMNISKLGSYENFMWYYGESDLPATQGYWILKESPLSPNDLLRIDWRRDIATGTYDIKYTNIKPGATENGGYIFVQYTAQTPYDHSWDIFNKGQNNHTYIEWNSSTEAGRVKDYNKYYDNNWHCWDTSHMNCACP